MGFCFGAARFTGTVLAFGNARMPRGDHAFSGVLADKRHQAFGGRIEPLGPLRARQQDQHPFLVLAAVVVAQQRVRVRIGGQHRVTLARRAAFVLVGVPEPRDAEGLAVDRCEPRRDVHVGAPVRLPESLRRDDAVLGPAPSVAEMGGVCSGGARRDSRQKRRQRDGQ